MGGMSVRWVFLLALGLMILGAIQCPHPPGSPPSSKRSGSPLKAISKAGRVFSRKISKMRSGSSSRSGSGSDSDFGSGSDNDEIPASGNSGRGRLPRSRSRSPTPGGGDRGGARSSGGASSSGGYTPNKMYGYCGVEQIPNRCYEVNNRGASQIINNMTVSAFDNIIQELRRTAATDECRNGPPHGRQPGSLKCQDMYGEFKKIPPQYRGECSEAISALCQRWPPQAGVPEDRKCTFFVQTGMRSSTRYDGFYISLEDCIDGIKTRLFMDNQLDGLGIRPPPKSSATAPAAELLARILSQCSH